MKKSLLKKPMKWINVGLASAALLVATSQSMTEVEALNWLFPDNSIPEEQQLTDEDIDMIREVYNTIQINYIEDLEKNDLLEGALKGMVNAIGDPYSEYLNKQESTSFDDSIVGSFQGIGVQFMSQNGNITVISPIDGTPAAEAGIQPNDIILEADGQELTNMDTNQVVELIRGPEGTEVQLKIQRGSSTFDITLVRAEIPIISVTGEIDEANTNIGNIRISQFSANTYDELVEIITNLRNEGVERFVFDLRANPGGLLNQALALSNMFVENGDVIMQVEESNREPDIFVGDDQAYGDFKVTEPYVVLIDNGSASASEILAAAINENTDRLLIGTTTFGKGTVQNITNESDIGELKLTIAKWLTPNGTWIHDTGVSPDVTVEAEALATALLLNTNEELVSGQSSEFVQSLSLILNTLGYEVDSQNYFDDRMEEVVKQFQTDNGLEADGIVTGDTAQALNDQARAYLEENDVQYDKAVELLLEEDA
ncbi:S41 family peptidase [Fundicoccus culcitae]|uniref:S41 family peptidase n=1 Tax=Fundicoccus culcitae TaxID=2969821 RepID=A0ABY5P7B4_9LACT|nr:S41 family peptidase [Fundicoccus culcitae]UUX34424.1 S41 family peptidase [Fundicoccus culcitae]